MLPIWLGKNKILIIFISLAAFVLNASGNSQNWQILDGKISPYIPQPLVRAQTTRQPLQSGDLNSDGTPECLTLVGGSAQITDCASGVYWRSPSDWRVTEAQIGDMNRDGVGEAILLVWRPFQPWPVDRFMPSGGTINDFHDKNGESCQIILIGWARNDWRELWAGSALIRPISQVNVTDLDGDGWQELAALEHPYDSTSSNNAITIWSWLGFGFTLVDRLEGSFHKLSIITDSSKNWLVTK